MSASSSRRHPHSLVAISAHNQSLVHLLSSRITRPMVDHVARQAAKCVYLHPAYASPSTASLPGLHSLTEFIVKIVDATNISTATLLSCLIYFDRLRAKMSSVHSMSSSVMHRIFLATLIVASKYLNDSAPKNSHWAAFVKNTHAWPTKEINKMERDMLTMLDFDLRFTEEDACLHFAPFMSTLAHQASTRASAVDKVSRASRIRAAQQTPSPTEPEAPAPATCSVPRQTSVSRQPSSTFAASVSKLAKRLSMAHIRPESSASSTASSTVSSAAPSPMPVPIRTHSSSTCSSEAGSLIDDTGSSSGSSSGWTSSESDSEGEDIEPRVYSATATSYNDYCSVPQSLDASSRAKKPFILRPASARNHFVQNRARKPSDTSSICTVTALSPCATSSSHASLSSYHSRRTSSKRNPVGNMHSAMMDGSMMSASVTMPAIPRSAASGGFLSRMWGAAKGQAMGHEKSVSMDDYAANPLKRLVLVSSRSASSRTGGAFNV